jgi:glycosyltransferase involved in cell wall biosynthesis
MGEPPEGSDLTFLFPAWNEQAGIARAVRTALEVGSELMEGGQVSDFDVLVIDDASTDGTNRILEDLAMQEPRVRVRRHATNSGLGATLRTGFAAASGATVLYTDSDLPFDLHEAGRMLRLMQVYDADLVAAYRHDRTGEGPRRYVYSRVYNLLVRASLALRIRDVNFAGKLIRREVLDAVELRSSGSFIDAELLARAQRGGFTIVQVGVDYFPRSRGTSTLSTGSVIAGMLADLVRLGPGIRAGTPPRSA